jgi:hypothetical protein
VAVDRVVGVVSRLAFGQPLRRVFARVLGQRLDMSLILFLGLFVGVLITGTLVSVGGERITEHPKVKATVGWRTRSTVLRKSVPLTLAFGIGGGLAAALALAIVGVRLPDELFGGAMAGLALGLVGGLILVLFQLIQASRSEILGDPPREASGRGVGGVLTASRNAGLVSALIHGMTMWLVIGIVPYLLFRLMGNSYGYVAFRLNAELADRLGRPAVALAFALPFGVGFAIAGGLANGLGAWFYHHWIRRRLARRHLLPRRLPRFLEWCALPERGWLRISDAAEFRHRDLLDYLAWPDEHKRR